MFYKKSTVSLPRVRHSRTSWTCSTSVTKSNVSNSTLSPVCADRRQSRKVHSAEILMQVYWSSSLMSVTRAAVSILRHSGDWCVGWGIMREKWTPRILAKSVRSMSGSRGKWFFGQTSAVKNYFLSFECFNFKYRKLILVGPLKDVRKFCSQSGQEYWYAL